MKKKNLLIENASDLFDHRERRTIAIDEDSIDTSECIYRRMERRERTKLVIAPKL